MPRISKEPMVRMNEILDTAESLFYSKGYEETAVSDIVKAIGVAQGTFYNYFPSKEAVLEALVQRHLAKIYNKIEDMVNSDRTPPNKFELFVYSAFNSLRKDDGWLFDFLYDNKHLHIVDKFIRQADIMYTPLTKRIIEEGNEQGYFKVAHPNETLDFINAVIACICHSLYQNQSAEQLAWRLEVAGRMIGSALGLEKGSLHLMI
jgi:AcrR family transcriptional regulator